MSGEQRPGGWPPWISLVALLPLALAASSLLPVWGLAAGATAAVLLLLEAVRRRTWSERTAALEASALVAVGTTAGYATALGTPPPLNVPNALAGILLFGTPVVAWAAAAGSRSRAGDGDRRFSLVDLRWDRSLALAVVILLVALLKCVSAFGSAPIYSWLVTAGSYVPLFLLCLLCLPRGRVGQIASALAVAGVLIAAVWDFASTEVMVTLAEPLTWQDLVARTEDPASVRILAEGLWSWKALGLVLLVVGGFLALTRGLRRLGGSASAWTLARVVGLTFLSGQLLYQGQGVIEPHEAERYLVAASAPWSSVHVRPDYEQRLDLDQARAWRRVVEPPIWEDGPAPLLSELAGRYTGRSIVFVLLESQRASDVAGLGEGALHHRPSSPRLSALAHEGLWFTNYFQASRPTHSALWAVVTGLPYLSGQFKPVYSGPEAARVGRLPELAALGYQVDWICPHSTKFDNWDRLMQEAGARFWINAPELEGLERTWWTAWGLDDGDLMEVARRRFETVTASGRPMFLGLLTISNHMPYSFPDVLDGVPLTHDLHGGMRYADHAVGRLIDALRTLPEERRPVVFVTADTTASEGLVEAEPMGLTNLEGLRIPGLLLLPDGALAGSAYTGVFSHEDALDLLYLLVAPTETSPRFTERHRVVVGSTGMLLTTRTYYDPRGNRFFDIAAPWSLVPVEDPPDAERLRQARDYYGRVRESMWSGGETNRIRVD